MVATLSSSRLQACKFLASCALLLAVSGWTSAAFADGIVRYPQSTSALPNAPEYSIELLKLALKKSGENLTAQAVLTDLNKARQFNALRDGKLIDVYWGGASHEREAILLPVRICIMKGLMGWRIPLMNKANAALFAETKTLADIKKYSAGQGYHWTDTQILMAAGLKVERSYETDNLYKMLKANRFDYFPRSLLEIEYEVSTHGKEELAIDPYVVIHYPSAFYFYVHQTNLALAESIRRGLEVAIKDGSFDQLFYSFHKVAIQHAKLAGRKVIEIPNPLLPKGAPLARKELWFSITDLKTMPD